MVDAFVHLPFVHGARRRRPTLQLRPITAHVKMDVARVREGKLLEGKRGKGIATRRWNRFIFMFFYLRLERKWSFWRWIYFRIYTEKIYFKIYFWGVCFKCMISSYTTLLDSNRFIITVNHAYSKHVFCILGIIYSIKRYGKNTPPMDIIRIINSPFMNIKMKNIRVPSRCSWSSLADFCCKSILNCTPRGMLHFLCRALLLRFVLIRPY